jgi:hypothetical protein
LDMVEVDLRLISALLATRFKSSFGFFEKGVAFERKYQISDSPTAF